MAKEGAGGGPDWNGLLKWSLAHGGDGTTPSRALSEEDRKWFMEAMQANTIDVVGRMKEIAQVMKTPDDVLQSHGVTTENIEDMLDELQEHVESIDMANDVCRVRVAGRIWPKNADELAQGADFDNIVELQPEEDGWRAEGALTGALASCSTRKRAWRRGREPGCGVGCMA
ncbi:uncharacterized protein LOC124673845 isoform X4 [Lolium rigidum]|uniref:uncharacterized protein LOC124673845 isoform X4 n=1 Tax=Lolium rigidum TaxID=89674 RepID=UPI001F5DB86B|nr:uncharacterized protein LOC124673845 isoform X4 [Lolium rigidum]